MSDSDLRGNLDDRVRLELGGKEVLICETYSVRASILTQPAHFSIRVGYGGSAAALIAAYPPGTPFTLKIGSTVQQTGFLDGFQCEGSVGATEVTFIGRDALAPLQSSYVTVETSYSNITYAQLVQIALTACGLNPALLVFDAATDLSARSRITQTNVVPVSTSHGKYVSGGGTTTVSTIQTKLGETWYEFVRRYIDRIGLQLWAGANGTFILSEPAQNAAPSYKIVRKRLSATSQNAVNVISAEYSFDTSARQANVTIYARVGQQKFCRGKAQGSATDPEMVALSPLLASRTLTLRDRNVANTEQGLFLAQRKLAEQRRQGWQLHYRVVGHTVPSLQGHSVAVWTPNTTVQVDDDEFGLHGVYWIESCEYRRAPQTETVLRLMRISDLLFGAIANE